jgi:uncharacterized protein GlcG (DUF336 family)
MPLTFSEAQAVSARVHEHADTLGARVTVAIVDEGGHEQVLSRMDGAPPLSARVAPAKAVSAALFHRDGAALREMQEASPGFFAKLDQVAGVPVIAGAGALLIRRGGAADGAILGAIAVSGAQRPGQDDECAAAGLAILTGAGPAPQ